MQASRMGRVLQTRAFRWLWLGQVFSQVPDKVYFVLMLELVGRRTDRDPTWTSAVLLAYTLPTVLFGAFAGALVDRWHPVVTQVVSNLLRAGCIALVPWVMPDSPWPVVILSFLVSTFSQPYSPAEGATIPRVVAREDLLGANALFAATVIGSILVGFLLGEPIVVRLVPDSPWMPALAVTAMYLVSTAFLALVRLPPGDPAPAARGGSLLGDFREGMAYLVREEAIRGAILRQVALYAMFAAVATLAILYARQRFSVPYTWLLSSAGVGMAAGSWLVGRWGGERSRFAMMRGGFLGAGVALAAMATWVFGDVPTLLGGGIALPCLMAVGVGIASAWVAIPAQTLLQEEVPDVLRGKVFAARDVATNLATSLPMGGVGPLSVQAGLAPVLAAMGVGMFMLAAWPSPRRSRSEV
ncbi:MAG: MFS transporter [Candidatus Sericytochromatia bacterium]|nr:MFS transporter [Candidatus Sericytochromatia bacterium]